MKVIILCDKIYSEMVRGLTKRLMMMEYKNILLIKMSSLGDILHSLPFADALRRRLPQGKNNVLVHPQLQAFCLIRPLLTKLFILIR